MKCLETFVTPFSAPQIILILLAFFIALAMNAAFKALFFSSGNKPAPM